MTIEYTIKELQDNIFAVIIPDSYHRAMLFCRCQEYYESPNAKFRGEKFSIWEYIEWYSREHNNKFTYSGDWGGFNIPYEIITECIKVSKVETPYDTIMKKIIKEIDNLRNKNKKSYVIGIDGKNESLSKHEICHGLYYINEDYKIISDELTNEIDDKQFKQFRDKLIEMGYTEEVVKDEIQAYLMTSYKTLGKGLKKLHKQYNKKLKGFLK